MSDQCEARCLRAAVGPTRREDEWSLSFFFWPLRGPACPAFALTHSSGSHTLSLTGEEEEIVTEGFGWSFHPTATGRWVSFLPLSLLCPSLSPHASSLSLSLSLSSPPPLAHPLSYDNLFWLLTSCLSLIQYSGFSAIQPWPITTLYLASPWISWRSYHLQDKHHTASVSGTAISEIWRLTGKKTQQYFKCGCFIFHTRHRFLTLITILWHNYEASKRQAFHINNVIVQIIQHIVFIPVFPHQISVFHFMQFIVFCLLNKGTSHCA